MFGSSGAHDLGYASNALLIALIRKLIETGALTKDQAADVLDDAVSTLEPVSHLGSVGAAIKLIRDDVKARIAA